MTPEKLNALIAHVAYVLAAHGLKNSCHEETRWAGSPEQQQALDGLHKALCDYLPPLPDQEEM